MKLLMLLALFGLAASVDVPNRLTTWTKDMTWMSTCWGDETWTKFMTTLTTTIDKCYTTTTPMVTWEDIFDTPMEPYPTTNTTTTPTTTTTTTTGDKLTPMTFKDGWTRERWMKVWKMSNLTCVMRTMGKWKDDNTINMEYYTKTLWDTVATTDDTFKTEMTAMFTRCMKIATSIPTDTTTDKFTKFFVTRMKFHTCEKTMMDMICAKKTMTTWMETALGPFTDEMATTWTFPKGDKYGAATLYTMVRNHEWPTEKKFIRDFMLSGMFDTTTTTTHTTPTTM